MEKAMQTCIPLPQRYRPSILELMLASRSFQPLTLRHLGSIRTLLIVFCVTAGVAFGQSTSSTATVNTTIDANNNFSNCYYTDPNNGTTYNSGQISITINNTETESAIYQCLTAGAPYDYIQNLVNAINQHSPFVSASVISDGYFSSNSSIRLTSRTQGDTTNYPISVSATWNTSLLITDPNTGNCCIQAFTGPSYIPSAPANMSGGQTSGEIIYPKYQVQQIIYATPGNHSSNGFTSATTDGTTTSVGSSFQSGNSVTFSAGGGFLGTGSSIGWTYGHSSTTGNSTADTSTITQATGVANASGNPSNAIDHTQDLFVIWLNPAVKVIQTGNTTGTFSMGTQAQGSNDPSPGQPQIQDQVELFAVTMMANAQGQTTVPLAALVPQVVDGQHVPGVGNICANNTAYQNNTCTFANQCGCVPSDFAPILAQDPLLHFASTDNPLNADTSGAAACTNPSSSAQCRYVPVMVANGSSTQVTELLAGPQSVGGNIPVNTFTQTDSTQTTQTLSQSASNSVGISRTFNLGTGFGLSFGLAVANTWTWTNNESTGAINGTSNSMTVTLSSSTVGCFQEIPVFEDTVFHTFVFQQPAGNPSCP
jgi:hypothetical protein